MFIVHPAGERESYDHVPVHETFRGKSAAGLLHPSPSLLTRLSHHDGRTYTCISARSTSEAHARALQSRFPSLLRIASSSRLVSPLPPPSAAHPSLSYRSSITPTLRAFSSAPVARAAPTPAAASSTPPPPPSALAPKISAIVDQISTLTLLEAADLVSALKVRPLSPLYLLQLTL